MRMVTGFKLFFSKNSLGCPIQPGGTRRCFDFPLPRIPPVGGPHANWLIKTTSLVQVYQKKQTKSNSSKNDDIDTPIGCVVELLHEINKSKIE